MGRSVKDILSQHLTDAPEKLKNRHTDIPDVVSDVIDKMLAKSPEGRFQSYQEIIGRLYDVANKRSGKSVSWDVNEN